MSPKQRDEKSNFIKETVDEQRKQMIKMEKDAEINKAEQAAEQASASEKLDNAEFDEGAASKEEEAMKKAMAGEEEKKTEAATGSKKEEDKAASSSSDSSSSSEKSDAEEDSGLSAKDVKRIK